MHEWLRKNQFKKKVVSIKNSRKKADSNTDNTVIGNIPVGGRNIKNNHSCEITFALNSRNSGCVETTRCAHDVANT